jgi:hypothetical protein
MTKLAQTGVGFALISAGIFAFVYLEHRSEWVALILILIGGNFVSQSIIAGALKGAADLLPFRRPEGKP